VRTAEQDGCNESPWEFSVTVLILHLGYLLHLANDIGVW